MVIQNVTSWRMNISLGKTQLCCWWLVAVQIVCASPATLLANSVTALPKVDFNRDIRPIFSEHCYACHGPDENKRKAGLRLDVPEAAFKELKSGNHALVPGDLTKSTLVERIVSADLEAVMPPPKHHKPLTADQIAVLKRWVQEGAQWKKHWSFIPPERPVLPAVKDRKWPRNAIDYFTS